MFTQLAQIIGKLTRYSSQKLKKGRGEAAPGLIALAIDPNFIANKHRSIPTRILITGTNGKTTTTNLVNQILKSNRLNPISNLNGSNLKRGIASALLSYKNQPVAVWECDEADFVHIAPQVKPTHLILNNIFRDQLDRYGEINSILDKWQQTLSQIPSCHILVNADDPNLNFLSQKLNHHQLFNLSLSSPKSGSLDLSADAIFCPRCQKPLNYSHLNFSHLGQYSCSCGFKSPHPHFTLTQIKFKNSLTSFVITHNHKQFKLTTKLKGEYNLYNILAAFSLASILNLDPQICLKTIADFKAIKGRQEIIKYKNKQIHFYLVKNPTGFNQVITTLKSDHKHINCLLALNDNLADGTDISWIWDVDFDSLVSFTQKIIVTGSRRDDLALRLKYANCPAHKYQVIKNYDQAIQALITQNSTNLYILPTYTALWPIRKIIKDQS